MKKGGFRFEPIFILLFFTFIYSPLKAQWSSYVYFSTDLGWGNYADFDDAYFINEQEGMYSYSKYYSPSSGGAAWAVATIDAGNNWYGVRNYHDFYTCGYAIYSSRKQHTFYTVERNCWIHSFNKSVNNGATWTRLFSGYGSVEVSIVDTSLIYFISWDGSANKHFVSKYVNGVITKIDSLPAAHPRLIFFPDSITGFIAASDTIGYIPHQIFKSASNGTNWNEVFSDTLINIRKMFFTSMEVGYVIGDSGKCIKTTDGGSTWQYLSVGTTENLNDLFFLNDSIGFITGNWGLIARTIDGGLSWVHDSTGFLGDVAKIFFINDSIGFALAGQELFRTNLRSSIGIWENYNSKNHTLRSYPNPSTDKFTIVVPKDFMNESNLILTVYDVLGRLVEQREFDSYLEKIPLSMKGSVRGVYYLNLRGTGKSFLAKIILN
jgi:hypothetical protein